MAVETELKLRILPHDMARLKRHPFLRGLSVGRAATRKLYSIYFDTPDLQLHQARMALRLRRVGRQWLQTLKGGGGVQAGLHQRHEWETPVAGEHLDFVALEALGAKPFPSNWRKKIRPMFVTDFTRSIRMVSFEGALIELSLDSGEVRAGESVHPISEVELELKSGEPLQLYRLALALLDIVPLEIESTSKAEYGYRLHAPVKLSVTKARVPKLESPTPVKEALQNMIWSCLSHLQSNAVGMVEHAEEEYLHQVRIALRRLRVVLSMVGKIRPDAELDSLREACAELGTELGRSREWDVFVMQTLPEIQKRLGGAHKLVPLVRKSEKLRRKQYQHVLESFKRGDFQRLLLCFGAWMNGSYWQKIGGDYSLPRFAAKILLKRSRRIRQRGEHIKRNADTKQFHALRIACKNLRYSAEMFASLYNTAEVAHYLRALAKLQDDLGEFNDRVVAFGLLQELDDGSSQGSVALIRGELECEYLNRLAALHKTWKMFSGYVGAWE